MEANAYDNNAEINHTWELKCQHCQSCQQCGLFRRLILDLDSQRVRGERYCRGKVKQRLLLLTAFAMFIVNRQRWLVVPQVLVEWATAAQGQNHFRLYVFLWPRRQNNPSDSPCLKLRVHGGATAAPQLGAHFISTLKLARQRQYRVLHASGGFRHFSSSPTPSASSSCSSSGQRNCRAPVFILYTCLDI